MRAVLGDPAVCHDEDLVGVLDGREAVGDGDDRLAARQLGDGLLDEVLVLRVDARGGLVENDDGRVFENGAGDGDALLFATGERAAALADDGVIAVRQRHNEVMAAGLLCRFDHLLLRGVRLAEEDVRADGIVEQIHVLEHHGDVAEQTAAGELAQIVPADADRAAAAGLEPGLYARLPRPQGSVGLRLFPLPRARRRQPDAHADRPAGIRRTIKKKNGAARPGCTVFFLFVQKIEDIVERVLQRLVARGPALVLRAHHVRGLARVEVRDSLPQLLRLRQQRFAGERLRVFFLRHGRKGIRSVIASSSFLCFDHGLGRQNAVQRGGGDAPA